MGAAAPAWADGVDGAMASGPRAVARAGATLVSDDNGAAILRSPGGLLRRGGERLRVGLGLVDDGVSYRPSELSYETGETEEMAPTIVDQAAPGGALHLSMVGTWRAFAYGLAYLDTASWARRLPSPGTGVVEDPALLDEIDRTFPHRYGGLDLDYQRAEWALAVATRVGDWLGAGFNVSIAATEAAETRHLWAGRASRDVLGTPIRDVVVSVDGRDRWTPGIGAGVFIAPPSLPIEMVLSMRYQARDVLSGAMEAASLVQSVVAPEVDVADDARAELTLPAQLQGHVGVRYLADRFSVEVDGEWRHRFGASAHWRLRGLQIGDPALLGEPLQVSLTELSSLRGQKSTTWATRAAVDAEIVAGFVWLSLGYAYHSGTGEKLTPGFADPGHHVAALGAEIYRSGITVVVGYSRTLAASRQVAADSHATLRAVNPFDLGAPMANVGQYDIDRTIVGGAIEIAWD